LTKSIKGL